MNLNEPIKENGKNVTGEWVRGLCAMPRYVPKQINCQKQAKSIGKKKSGTSKIESIKWIESNKQAIDFYLPSLDGTADPGSLARRLHSKAIQACMKDTENDNTEDVQRQSQKINPDYPRNRKNFRKFQVNFSSQSELCMLIQLCNWAYYIIAAVFPYRNQTMLTNF